jgi:hypothetical protein
VPLDLYGSASLKSFFFFFHGHAELNNILNHITVEKDLRTLLNGSFLLVSLSLCVSVTADSCLVPLCMKGGSQPSDLFFCFLEISKYPQNVLYLVV